MTVQKRDLIELEEQAQAKLRSLIVEQGELDGEYSDLQARIQHNNEQVTRAKKSVQAIRFLRATLDFEDDE